jgi:ATP-dependent Clp protease adaptor protein ClpS
MAQRNTQTEELLLEETLTLEEVLSSRKLIVHNDDVNTFDWVIETLVHVCEHSWEQAEQCSLIIHNNGKCSVKHGDFTFLKPMKDAIQDRGISATIE